VMENRVGISVHGISSFLALKESTMISRNNINGIEIHAGAKCMASATEISYSLERSGVYLTGKGSRLDFQDGKINGNKLHGVFLENLSSCSLANSKIDLNQETGLKAKDAEEVVIENCHFQNLLIGIMIEGAKIFKSAGSTYTKHSDCGVLVVKAILELKKNVFIDETIAVIVDEEASGKIQENSTYPKAPETMIEVTEDAGKVIIEGNTMGSP
jgi:Right handed beta helix region